MTNLVMTSDLHGYLPEIPECDILLIAGDVTPVWDHERHFQAHWLRTEFNEWLNNVPAREVVAVGGNHDFVLQDNPFDELRWHLLYDEDVTIDGIKIWGSPYSPRFGSWGFMMPDPMLAEKWAKIPEDVDILMVHGPMYGYGDRVSGYSMTKRGWESEAHVGSQTLRNRLDHVDYPNLKTFVCGHIHEEYGTIPVNDQLTVYNVSHMDDTYRPVNPPMELTLCS